MNKLFIYTKMGCKYCALVKGYLKAKGVTFVEKNIDKDRQAKDYLKQYGFRCVPVTMYNNSPDIAVTNYDTKGLDMLIGISQH